MRLHDGDIRQGAAQHSELGLRNASVQADNNKLRGLQRGRDIGEDEKAIGGGGGAERAGGDIFAAVQKRDIQPCGAADGIDPVGERGGDGRRAEAENIRADAGII